MSTEIPRPEHPRPQFQRDDWLNLNGTWQFAMDFSDSGSQRGWPGDPSGLDREILVPFCPESRLSGVGYTDFIPCVWYARTFSVPASWSSRSVKLHFGAVDHDTDVWVNGTRVGSHEGGQSSFAFEITRALVPGENAVVVRARDDVRSGRQPAGKQSVRRDSFAAWYTRVTGIWQTVWLEAVAPTHLDAVQVLPDLGLGGFTIIPRFAGMRPGLRFRATLTAASGEQAQRERRLEAGGALFLDAPGARCWSPADPHLYDLVFEIVEEDRVVDRVTSYAGLRSIAIDGNRFRLNGEPLFLRLVLDQGMFPDGIWTAPSDEALRRDIECGIEAGFNGARLHQKVFEERAHYWADRLGYLTWAEFGDWGIDGLQFFPPAHGADVMQRGFDNHLAEWLSVVERDRNHPSIITWTPFNESQRKPGREGLHDRAVRRAVAQTRALDPTRPVHDVSGFTHVETDVFTAHEYEQEPVAFREKFSAVSPGAKEVPGAHAECAYQGQPYLVDEYGGTWWTEDAEETASWGYGQRPASKKEAIDRIEALTEVLVDHPHMAGYCYTQLTDVEQEQNGLYTADRVAKFDRARVRAIFGRDPGHEGESDE